MSTTTPPLTLTDRLANYEMLLREIQFWCLYDGFCMRTAQARDYADTIERALAGEETHILARHELLQEAAATLHQLTSVSDYPELLRQLADTLDDARIALDARGHDEWEFIGGLDRT